MYHLSVTLEDKKLKVILLERDLFLEKYARFLSKTQFDIAFSRWDLAHTGNYT